MPSRPRCSRRDVLPEERASAIREALDAPASCSASSAASPTRRVIPRPTRSSAELIREKIRSIGQRSRDGRGALPEGPLRSAPSDPASTPTTSRPTTCRTSGSSICARTRSRAITESGIDTAARSFEFDAIVFATGFDAMTGALMAVDIAGRDGVTLAEKWARRPDDLSRPHDRRASRTSS